MTTAARSLVANCHDDLSQPPLARLAGPLALIAGALFTGTHLVFAVILDRSQPAASMAHPLFVPSAIANFVAYCALLLALVAVYEWQARRAGLLGVVGFIAALVGTIWMTGDMWFEAFVVPWLGDVAFDALAKVGGTLVSGALVTYVFFTVGWALFGIASLRARIYPAAFSLAILISGAVIPWTSLPVGILLGFAFAWLGGWMLWCDHASPIRERIG